MFEFKIRNSACKVSNFKFKHLVLFGIKNYKCLNLKLETLHAKFLILNSNIYFI